MGIARIIVVTGDPTEGFSFKFHGPFYDHDEAMEFASHFKFWWITELWEPPRSDDTETILNNLRAGMNKSTTET